MGYFALTQNLQGVSCTVAKSEGYTLFCRKICTTYPLPSRILKGIPYPVTNSEGYNALSRRETYEVYPVLSAAQGKKTKGHALITSSIQNI